MCLNGRFLRDSEERVEAWLSPLTNSTVAHSRRQSQTLCPVKQDGVGLALSVHSRPPIERDLQSEM